MMWQHTHTYDRNPTMTSHTHTHTQMTVCSGDHELRDVLYYGPATYTITLEGDTSSSVNLIEYRGIETRGPMGVF